MQLEHINVLGYFQLSLNDGMDSDVKTLTHNGETLYTCQLNQSFVSPNLTFHWLMYMKMMIIMKILIIIIIII